MKLAWWNYLVFATLIWSYPVSGATYTGDPPVLSLRVTPERTTNFVYHGESIEFDASTSYDPDSEAGLSFFWYVNSRLVGQDAALKWTPDLEEGADQEIKIKIIDVEGLYTEDVRVYSVYPVSKRFYYLKDHQGSVRATIDENANVVHYSDYYPFGMQMPNRVLENESPDERYTGHERDSESGLVYAGARFYDPEIGRWNRPDPRADEYPGWSPYNYTLNNPVNGFDPDGNYVVFINGWYTQYYTHFMPATIYWKGFDNGIMDRFPGEGHHYVDGSMGGVFNTMTINQSWTNLSSKNRFEYGYRKGLAEAAYVRSKLQTEDESVKIVSHSMGGAFGIGYAVALASEGLNIEFHLAIAPYQSHELVTYGITTFQVGDDADWVAGNIDIPGATRIPKARAVSRLGLYKFNVNPVLRHLIRDYDPQDIMDQLFEKLYYSDDEQ